jgi:hypothetical protein
MGGYGTGRTARKIITYGSRLINFIECSPLSSRLQAFESSRLNDQHHLQKFGRYNLLRCHHGMAGDGRQAMICVLWVIAESRSAEAGSGNLTVSRGTWIPLGFRASMTECFWQGGRLWWRSASFCVYHTERILKLQYVPLERKHSFS